VPRWTVAVLIVAFFALAAGYAFVTPYRQSGVLLNQRTPDGFPAPAIDIGAPDERQHANYVSGLLQGRGFPVLKPGDPTLGETYQSHQPPLYYLLAAAVAKVCGIDPTLPAGIHLRWINILIGGLTVLGLFRLGQRVVGNDWVAALIAAVGGFMPMVLALHAAISNDPLLYMLSTWALVLLVAADGEGWTPQLATRIGLLVGLALNTKSTAVALLPLILVAGFIASRRDKTVWPKVGVALILAIALATPWWIRNTSLYGDPLAMNAFKEAFTGNPRTQDLVQAIGPGRYWTEFFGWWTVRSFFGAFGYMDIFWNPTLYRALAALGAIAALGCLRKERVASEAASKSGYVLALTYLGLVGLLYFQFNLTYFQAQSRYLYPAIGPIALLLGTGLAVWLGSRHKAGAIVLILALVLGNLINLAWLPEEFKGRAQEITKISSHPYQITRRILGTEGTFHANPALHFHRTRAGSRAFSPRGAQQNCYF